MPTVYRDTGYSLMHLVEDIKSGRIALPDIQRPFVWSSAKARDLLDSMYRGYPIGTLMFWETGADVGTRQIGVDDTEKAPQLLIVDGQQRLTSLYAVITGQMVLTKKFEEKRIRIAFRPEDATFEVTDAAIELDPEFVPDITALWTGGYKSIVRQFLQRLSDARGGDLSDDHQDLLEERIDRVRDLRDFPFQVVELGAGTDEEQVAEIFVRINSEGVQLKNADFVLTLMSVHWEKGRKQLEAFSRDSIAPVGKGANPKNPFIDPSPDQMLRVSIALAFRRAKLQNVYSILRGKDLQTGIISTEQREQQFGVLSHAQEKVLDLTNWHEFLKCLQAAGFRSRKMVTSTNALLTSYAIWLIGRYDFGLSAKTLRPVIARWFFMVQTTARYSASPESQLAADLGRVGDLPSGDGQAFIEALDRIVKSNFTNDFWEISLPNKLDTMSSKSPSLMGYLAALQLLDAEALFSDVRVRDLLDPSTKPPRAVERHHLFPKNYLASIEITDLKQVNSIANMAYLDWLENSDIGSDAPSHYWSHMTAGLSPARLKKQQHLHALPVGWEQLEFKEFLERRRVLIAGIIREGFATLWEGNEPTIETTTEDLLSEEESQTLEFKESARSNGRTQAADTRLEGAIVKTVCGFLNAEGGKLFIGVTDDGTPTGLEADLQTLTSRPNLDGYELMLRGLLELNLSAPTAATVRIEFPRVAGESICMVTVAPSGKPVFSKPLKGEGLVGSEFWVRTGNQTLQLHGDAMVAYQEDHWG